MKKLLVVVDYQNDFVTGSLGHLNCLNIYPSLLAEVKLYEQRGDDIIFTRDSHGSDYLDTIEGKNLPIPHCIKNSDGYLFYKELEEISKRHIVVEKETFPAVGLYKTLVGKEYEEIKMTGVVTNICVISNAIIIKSIFPNTPIIIDEKLCASNDKKLEKEAYDIMENLHFNVMRSPDFIKTNDVKMGDLIRVQRKKGYYHFGIAISDKECVHFSAIRNDSVFDPKNINIIRTSIEDFYRHDTLEVKVPYDSKFSREEVKDRALEYVGSHTFRDKVYNVVENNCEHFARYIYYGVATCEQLKEYKSILATAKDTTIEAIQEAIMKAKDKLTNE